MTSFTQQELEAKLSLG